MSKIDPVVRQETRFIALCTLAGLLLLQGVCLLVGWWDYTVLLGGLLGGVTAVGNFLLMGLTVQKAVNQEKKQAARTIQLSQSGRLILQGIVLVLGATLGCFNLWATAIPLLLPRVGVMLRPLLNKKELAPTIPQGDGESEPTDTPGGDTI